MPSRCDAQLCPAWTVDLLLSTGMRVPPEFLLLYANSINQSTATTQQDALSVDLVRRLVQVGADVNLRLLGSGNQLHTLYHLLVRVFASSSRDMCECLLFLLDEGFKWIQCCIDGTCRMAEPVALSPWLSSAPLEPQQRSCDWLALPL